ncbi:LicD family protein [Treponema sp. OttesenSCG-928-L16]|nr:LicD family protein [Treponema sp. OttesenSCG-928-L16]
MPRHPPIQNPAQLLENMVLIRDLLEKNGITCFIMYGTLLGAIREKNFIAHDDDVDFGIFGKDYDKLIIMLPEILAHGFTLFSERNGRLLQFNRKGEQVDIFAAYPIMTLRGRRWDLDAQETVAWSYFKELDTIEFLGHTFNMPRNPEKILRNLYGSTWRIPIKDVRNRKDLSYQIKRILKNPGLTFFYLSRYMKKKWRKYTEKKNYHADSNNTQ